VQDASLNIGQGSASQGAFTGVTQNRLMPSVNATWNKGRHTVAFGGSFSYTQLNTLDNRTGNGIIASADLGQFLQGILTPNDDFQSTALLLGNANRYYRANQTGEYIQDKFQLRPNLSLTGGVRFDWDGGFSEKYGRIYITLTPTNTPMMRRLTPSPRRVHHRRKQQTVPEQGGK
jgi:outer membrane receptor protein involved in Fe transport